MLPKHSIKRPVTTVMVMLIAILAGVVSLLGLDLDLMPTIDIPIAVVSTTYSGAGPEEIETLITKPIESALGTVSNVDSISSTSSANSSMVLIQFVDGTDLDMAAIDMREKIDLVKGSLPEDANDPMVLKMDMAMMSSIMVGVSSEKDLASLTTLLEDSIVNRIERIEGVAAVSIVGGVTKEIQVTMSPEKMQGYGITASQISGILKSENANFPTGEITQGEYKLQLRAVGEFRSVDEIRELPITTSNGVVIHLSDVADVSEGIKDEDSYTIINGKESIILSIQKQSDANIVNISDKVNAELDRIYKDYPDINISMLSDTSEYIKTSVNNVLSTAFQSALLAIVVLLFFLRDPKTSFIIGVSIPTSLVVTFALMYVNDMTLNIISLGGLTIGIGMLVDNSVVVLENIFRHWKNGSEPKIASEIGASEVSMSVMASTLTTVAVFIPLMFVKGSIGQMFKDLSLTVSFSLMASLIVSLTFVPMACSLVLKREETKVKKISIFSKFLDAWGRGVDAIDSFYRKVLTWSLKNKKKTVAVVMAAFIGTLALIPLMGIDLMPVMDEGSASITIDMPKGTVIGETTKIIDEVLLRIEDIEETELMYLMVGGSASFMGGSTDSATVNMNFVGKDERERSTEEIVIDIRERLKGIAGAEIKVSSSSNAMGSYGGGDISIQLNGDETDKLREIGNDIVAIVSQMQGTAEVESSLQDSVPEANIVINRTKASVYGINAATIANAVSTAITGSVATQYKVDGTEIDIRLKQNGSTDKYISDLKNITITAPTGVTLPLTEVADIVIKDGATSISRIDQHKYITVSAKSIGRDANSIKNEIIQKLDKYNFPDGYDYEFTGSLESMTESYNNLMIVLIVAVLLVYMIMASQFESLIYPFIVMFSVPLALTGGIFGLFITGKTISVTAFMGFIMLVGMVVNNAIVLVDYTNQLREKGMECIDALIEAGPTRLRPILMTTLTTILGLVPMALSTSEGTEMQQPLAISVIFGLTISTIVTLVFIPVLYAGVDKFRFRTRRNKKKNKKIKSIEILDESTK